MNQQQEDGEVFEIPTSKRNSEQTEKSLFSTVFAIIYNLSWAVLFLIFRHYNDSECQVIDQWTKNAEIFLFMIVGYKLIIELPIQQQTNGQWKSKLFDIVDYCELFINIVLLVGLTYAYLQYEECPYLRGFVLGYLIVTYLILTIWLITFIFVFCSREQFSRSQ